MKQTKWQRLATIGLCSSLVINAFSGVTAVAETITIESSPTVASSAKEATSASSATPESTESSQETTETSREEVTQETEKPEVVKEEQKEETEAKKQEEETITSEVVQPNPVLAPTPVSGIGVRAGNMATLSPQLVALSNKLRVKTVSVPSAQLGIIFESEDNASLNMADFSLKTEMLYNRFGTNVEGPLTEAPLALVTTNTLVAENTKVATGFDIVLPSVDLVSVGYKVELNVLVLKDPEITIPKYIDSLKLKNLGMQRSILASPTGAKVTDATLEMSLLKEGDKYTIKQPLGSVWYQSYTQGNYTTRFLSTNRPTDGYSASVDFFIAMQDINLIAVHKKVTESFKDTAGATIPAPTGFTQGKQTSITSNNYTFKQAGTLPETYKASNGKTYKFKGWYKGKTKPNTLTTTKAPSYPVTYNDDDDLTVVYEEIEVFDFPALTYQFGFVDESGKRVDASTIDLTYDKWRGEVLTNNVNDWKTVSLEKGQVAPTKNNLKEIVYPSHSLEIMNGRSSQYSAANLTFKIPKYYENISVYNKNGTFDTAYPFPTVKINTSTTPLSNRSQLFQLKKSNNQSFIFNQTTEAAPADVQVPYNLREIVYDPAASINKGLYHMLDKPIYYYLTNRKVTENFVDTNGTKITPPTGFTQGNQIPMTSNTFKYTAEKALPASYTTGGKTYIFQGWYKGKTKPNTLTTSTTPTYNTTFDGNDDMTAMYKEEVPKASVALTRTTAETVTSGGNVTWRATITNTSQAPLTTATIKKSTAWTTGLAAPTAMIVTPAGGTAKTVPVTATTWTNGVSLGTDIPVGKSATVQFTTKATGTAGQVLRAGITTSGNYSGVSASATVRVKDNDQAIVTPTAEGFISVPTFNFGQVGVAGSTQQHGLKKAADYYGNGTRNPYLRIKKTQANWSLTAQLSQPKSATDSLPTATRLLLGAAPVSSFSNYNQPTELKNAVGTTSAISLNANNTATRIIANQQFTGSNIYQLDFTFNNVKLEVPANQGVKGQQYQAAITWNLVTGP
ncbi:WxL domain-containing protein [Enterococcus faecalis]|uniref:WxL domain-containing protein n=1 Tax=Enterococcus faecalis TaxID=1351 RepID=UPI004041AEC3